MLIIALATAVRCLVPGVMTITWDEVNLLFWANRIAQFGDWVWLSNNPMSWTAAWNPVTQHSPLNNYLLALPVLLSTDPRVARLFVQGLGVIAVIVVYLLIRRYFGAKAAFIGGLLLALLPTAVLWSRFVWNPNLAQPFIALYLLTGLLGYYEGKGWARPLHWLCLAIAAQNHPTNILLALPSGMLVAIAFLSTPQKRRTLVVHTLASIILAGVTFIPWTLGTFGGEAFQQGIMLTGRPDGEAGISQAPSPPLDGTAILSDIIDQFSQVVGATSFDTTNRGRADAAGIHLYPPLTLDVWLRVYSIAVLLGAVLLLLQGIRRPRLCLPQIFIVLTVIMPLIAAHALVPGEVEDFYVLSIMFGAACVAGILLSALDDSRLRFRRVLTVSIVTVTALTFAWLNTGTYGWLATYGWEGRLRAPMDTFLDLVHQWRQEADDVTFLIEGGWTRNT